MSLPEVPFPVNVIITDHAHDRMKERLGLPKRAHQAAAERAYVYGRHHSDAKGRLKRFLDGRWLDHRTANNVRIYGEHIYFFRDSTLITVYEVPKSLRAGIA
jgi:hypothetical protein